MPRLTVRFLVNLSLPAPTVASVSALMDACWKDQRCVFDAQGAMLSKQNFPKTGGGGSG